MGGCAPRRTVMGRISMSRSFSTGVAGFAGAAGFACLALASCADEPAPDPTPARPVPASATSQLWFVELEAPAVAQGGAIGRVVGEHVVFHGDAMRLGIRVKQE